MDGSKIGLMTCRWSCHHRDRQPLTGRNGPSRTEYTHSATYTTSVQYVGSPCLDLEWHSLGKCRFHCRAENFALQQCVCSPSRDPISLSMGDHAALLNQRIPLSRVLLLILMLCSSDNRAKITRYYLKIMKQWCQNNEKLSQNNEILSQNNKDMSK